MYLLGGIPRRSPIVILAALRVSLCCYTFSFPDPSLICSFSGLMIFPVKGGISVGSVSWGCAVQKQSRSKVRYGGGWVWRRKQCIFKGLHWVCGCFSNCSSSHLFFKMYYYYCFLFWGYTQLWLSFTPDSAQGSFAVGLKDYMGCLDQTQLGQCAWAYSWVCCSSQCFWYCLVAVGIWSRSAYLGIHKWFPVNFCIWWHDVSDLFYSPSCSDWWLCRGWGKAIQEYRKVYLFHFMLPRMPLLSKTSICSIVKKNVLNGKWDLCIVMNLEET